MHSTLQIWIIRLKLSKLGKFQVKSINSEWRENIEHGFDPSGKGIIKITTATKKNKVKVQLTNNPRH